MEVVVQGTLSVSNIEKKQLSAAAEAYSSILPATHIQQYEAFAAADSQQQLCSSRRINTKLKEAAAAVADAAAGSRRCQSQHDAASASRSSTSRSSSSRSSVNVCGRLLCCKAFISGSGPLARRKQLDICPNLRL